MNRPLPDDGHTPQVGGMDRALAGMRASALAGKPVRADDYLEPMSSDQEWILDLVYAEYLIRCETEGPPSVTELVGRFPDLAERIRRQIGLHNAIESESATRNFVEAPKADPDWSEPQFIGRYRVLNRLGRGGQATAYRAFHPDLQRDVVVKLAHHAAPRAIEQLRAEARTLASLDHPGLVRVHDFDFQDGRPFLVMESVGGRSLDVVAAAAPMTPKSATEIVARAARAANHGHFYGVVHRDLKPENILIDGVGNVRIIDFGLATLLGTTEPQEDREGIVEGTLRYMAPEQARGEHASIGPRTDVFALGGVLYFLLTGSPPYAEQRFDALSRAAVGDWDRNKLQAKGIPTHLKAVCEKALAANPADRYQTANQLADALDRAKGRPQPRLMLGVMLLIAVGLTVVGWRMLRPTPPDERKPSASALTQPEFDVRVWDDNQGRYRELLHMLPLSTGEKLRYEVPVPAGLHLALFAIDPEGGVRQLASQSPRSEPGVVRFPAEPTESSVLREPEGTVALLICGRAAEAVSLDDVRTALGADRWPTLPKSSVVKIEGGKVFIAGTTRSVGPPTGQPDPEGDVVRRLDAARAKLRNSCELLAGIAFSHR